MAIRNPFRGVIASLLNKQDDEDEKVRSAGRSSPAIYREEDFDPLQSRQQTSATLTSQARQEDDIFSQLFQRAYGAANKAIPGGIDAGVQRVKEGFSRGDYNLYGKIAKGDIKTGIDVIDQPTQVGSAYIQNRVIEPVVKIPENIKTLRDKDSTLLEKGIAGLSTVGALIPGVEDAAYAGFDALKANIAGKNPVKGFTGEEYTGLGEAFTPDNERAAAALNVAELPLVLAAGTVSAKGLANKTDDVAKILGDTDEIADAAKAFDYTPAGNLSAEEKQIEKTFGNYLKNNFEEAVQKYRQKYGKILNTDNVRELSEDYNADRMTRSAAVHEPASAFTRKMYEDELKRAPGPGESNMVLFTAGGTGAGKSTAVRSTPTPSDKIPQMVYDTNMSGFKSSDEKIQQALAAGKDVRIAYVYRDPEAALTMGALPRSLRMGRTVPLDAHADSHANSLETIKKLYKKYEDNPKVDIGFISNNGTLDDIRTMTFDEIKDISYNKDELKKSLAKKLDELYAEGKISAKQYQGFSGKTAEEIETLGARVSKQPQAEPAGRKAGDQTVSPQLGSYLQDNFKPEDDIDTELINKIFADQKNVPLVKVEGAADGAKQAIKQSDDLPAKNYPKGEEELQFVQTVRESPRTKPPVAEGVEGSYKPITNKETLTKAQQFIDSKGIDAAVKRVRGTEEVTAEKTAVGLDLMRRFQNEGNWEMAIDVAEDLAGQAKTQGQAIQALSMWSRLTPEGALAYAQRVVKKANEGLGKKKQITLSPESAKEITDLAREVQGLEEGSRERIVATAKLLDKVAEQVPPSLGQKLSTLQTMSHLINPKTFIRNIGGNAIFAGAENISDAMAAGMDSVLSLFTGERTKALPSIKTQLKGLKEGFKLGLEDALNGIDTSGINTQYSLPNKTFRKGVLSGLETVLNIELRAPDRAAYQAAFDGSLDSQMRAKGISEATADMVKIAHEDALYRTFQDDSLIARVLQSGKKTLNKIGLPGGDFGVGDLVLKYPKTPGNLISRGLDYSPAGLIKSAFELSKGLRGDKFDQKHFVETLARATNGTGLIALGFTLANNGIITGRENDDFEFEMFNRMTGEGGFRINLSALRRYLASGFQKQEARPGDKTFTYDWAQPMAISLSMGADIAEGTKQTDLINNLFQSLATGEQSLTNQPVIQNTLDFIRDINNYGFSEATKKAVIDSATSLIPTLSKQIAEYADRENVARDTYDEDALAEFGKKIQSRVPGLRNQLPAVKDQYGRDAKQYRTDNNFVNVFLNPGFVAEIEDDQVAKEIKDIYRSTGSTQQTPRYVSKKVSVNGEVRQITDEERRQMQEYVGEVTQAMFAKAVADPKFQELSDEDKTKAMANMMSDAHTAAKIQFLGHRPEKISKKVQDILRKRQQEKDLPLIKKPE